jgi:ribonuclease HI
MLAIAIDGACRRNGKPNCVSAGGIFITRYNEDNHLVDTRVMTNYEINSTNQRGELLALLTAFDYIWESKESAQVITDSEYIFNAITKEWCASWAKKGWITALNEPVKNKDIWLEIMNAQRRCEEAGIELALYHIKGHTVSFGKVTAQTLLAGDTTGFTLFKAVDEKVSTVQLKDELYDKIVELSLKNNGFELAPEVLKRFIVINTVADAIATKCVEAADALM